MAEVPATKVCVRCGVDVAGRARVKDASGRYLCRACFEAAEARRAARLEATGSIQNEPVRIAGIHGPDGNAGGGLSSLSAAGAEDNALIFELEPTPGAVGPQGGPCPTCGHFLASGVRVCVGCGYDRATGQNLGTSIGVEKVRSTRAERRDSHLEAVSREAGRRAYVTAGSVLLFGVVGTLVAIGALTDDFAGNALFLSLTLGICIPASFLAFLVFALCGHAGGVGFFLILLEIAAICTAFAPIFVLELLFPMPRYARWALRAAVLGGLSAMLLDMEEPTNYLFAFVVFLLMLGSAVAAAMILGGVPS